MSRRDQVRMTDPEIASFLAEPHLCTIGTIGPKRPGGAPNTVHLVAMNYGFLEWPSSVLDVQEGAEDQEP